MASRSKRQTSGQEKIWNFNVSDPTLHPNGFTIYKITTRVFKMSEPDNLKEIIVWKRYNDFKELYKGLVGLHKALHRKDSFPIFAKPKLFGRFEEAVIEERRKSATDLLVFVGGQSHLYNSKLFEEFLQGGKVREGMSGKMLKPSKLDFSQSISTPQTTEPLQPVKHPPMVDKTPEESSQQNGETGDELEGVWNFPQVPDNISLNSFDDTDEAEAIDAESVLSASLPEMDMSMFDPLQSEGTPGQKTASEATSSQTLQPEGTPGLKTSSSWLIQAMDTCAGIENETEQKTEEYLDDEKPLTLNLDILTESQSQSDKGRPGVECGKGDLDLSWNNTTSPSSSSASSVTSSPRHGPRRSPSRRLRSGTNESVSTMDLKEDYIYHAADQICLAQECEASSKFELAFSYYKSGVGILLQGVQNDKNKARRDAVRRKTAQYLMKAEDLYNRHLVNDTVDDKRWSTADNILSPAGDLDPTLNFIKAPASEMKKLKVLGTIDKVLLVMDKTSDQTYVIKTIHKSSVCSKYHRTILPLSCPNMVNLHKFYETDNAIFLLLQHAMGGKLWNYIGEYLHYNKGTSGTNIDDVPVLSSNVYSGCHMSSKDSIKQQPVPPDTVHKMDDVFGQNDFEDNKLPDTISDVSDISDEKNDKPDYNRITSLSSEENTESNDVHDFLEQKDNDVFQEILLSNQTTLENFSINSIESYESRPRVDSVISDNIGSIPEEVETCWHDNQTDAIDNVQPDSGDPEAEAIVQNAKDLLKTVERTLSQTDSEVNKCIYPDKVSTNQTDNNHGSNSEEVSIYDINRSFSDSNSDNEIKNNVKTKSRTSTVQSSSSETISGSKKSSRASTLTEQVKVNPPKLSRMSSKELSRSASFERELKSPHFSRERSISDVFRQMDLAMSSVDQIKLPDTCIKQWVAEIIIAVSRLHAEGIICRDLHPDNILLGENGSVLLSYFCQISLTDNILDMEAVDQLYVAPEVNSIGNFTEVCDWWSVGTLLYELVTLRSLKSCHPGGITPHTQLYLPSNVSTEAQSLLHQLLCFNPKERLGSGINGCEDIKAHPFFGSINWNQLEKQHITS